MKTHYRLCPACEFIAKEEAYRITEAQELEIYKTHENTIEDPRYVAYFRRFIEAAILPWSKGSAREALDFGSGPSPVLARILERDYGYSVTIHDYFFEPGRTFETRVYDLITSTEVVEHLWDPLETFRLLRSLMKPGGVLAVMTRFHPGDFSVFEGWHYTRDRSHVAFYTPRTMAVIAEKCGLVLKWTDDRSYSVFVLE
jgi:SAM-dependent methyltransferase